MVEDDESIRMMLSVVMTMMWDDLTPVSFENGYKAWDWLDRIESGATSEVPELALLDIRMPGPQGHEIAQRLRSMAPTSKIVIVIMTAYRFDAEEQALIEDMAKPDLFIRKPLPSPDELKVLLDNTVANRKNNKVA